MGRVTGEYTLVPTETLSVRYNTTTNKLILHAAGTIPSHLNVAWVTFERQLWLGGYKFKLGGLTRALGEGECSFSRSQEFDVVVPTARTAPLMSVVVVDADYPAGRVVDVELFADSGELVAGAAAAVRV